MSRVIPVYQKLGHGHLSNPKSKVTKYPLYVAIDVHYGPRAAGFASFEPWARLSGFKTVPNVSSGLEIGGRHVS